jgi:hypothetical protein
LRLAEDGAQQIAEVIVTVVALQRDVEAELIDGNVDANTAMPWLTMLNRSERRLRASLVGVA